MGKGGCTLDKGRKGREKRRKKRVVNKEERGYKPEMKG
jgi:hypothetical protein